MSDMVQLTDAELDLVAGGSFQSFNYQSNFSSVYQSAYASSVNYGSVSAFAAGSGSVAVAVGSAAAATNVAYVSQSNNISD